VNGTKVVPNNIFELLTPISLAYWVCDDGGKNKTGFHFATNAFSLTGFYFLSSFGVKKIKVYFLQRRK
jgi:hypothetical protein